MMPQHRRERAEHEQPVSAREHLVDRLEERVELAARFRVVAMFRERAAPGARRSGAGASARPGRGSVAPRCPAPSTCGEDLAPRRLGDAAIEPPLQRREVALELDLGAFGQLGRDVFLRAPQHERLEPRAQHAAGPRVAVGDRDLEAAPERGLRPEQSRLDEGEDRPQVAQRVLDRRPGQREPVLGVAARARPCAICELGFFAFCASSRISVRKWYFASCSRIERASA